MNTTERVYRVAYPWEGRGVYVSCLLGRISSWEGYIKAVGPCGGRIRLKN